MTDPSYAPRALLVLLLAATPAGAAFAGSFPPITEQERALTAVPGQPNAPAAVLYRRGELWMMMDQRGAETISSRLVVQERVKILTAAGKALGNVKIFHSAKLRLHDLEARTVLPDGRVVPLPSGEAFRATASQSGKSYFTTFAFPAVEVGAILDYQYEQNWDNPFFLEPWTLQERIPVEHAEIVFHIPSTFQGRVWSNDPAQVGIKTQTTRLHGSTQVRAWADSLPAVPEEPFSVPFQDLAARVMVVPMTYTGSLTFRRLFKDWASTCELFDKDYRKARDKDEDAVRKARELGAAAGADRRAQAAAVYRFVRDEIETEWVPGVEPRPNTTVGDVFTRRRGSFAEKALLLQTMLAAIKVDANLVWAADRRDGAIDLRVANPTWFDRVLVAAWIDGARLLLDPGDRALAFGHLLPGFEGAPAVVFDPKKPETIELPEAPSSDNTRRAVVDLALDANGRLAGHGTLALTGQHAWRRTRWQPDPAKTSAAWEKWLRAAYTSFEVTGVTVKESLDEASVEVAWDLAQHAEEALGDEVTLSPSRPLGPRHQPFQESARRYSPVAFEFAEREEVELKLHWPQDWRLDSRPKEEHFQSPAGQVAASVETDPEGHSLVYRRRFDLAHRTAATGEQLRSLQELFSEVSKSDAQALVLARR